MNRYLATVAVRPGHRKFLVNRSLRELFGRMGICDSVGPRAPLVLASQLALFGCWAIGLAGIQSPFSSSTGEGA